MACENRRPPEPRLCVRSCEPHDSTSHKVAGDHRKIQVDLMQVGGYTRACVHLHKHVHTFARVRMLASVHTRTCVQVQAYWFTVMHVCE